MGFRYGRFIYAHGFKIPDIDDERMAFALSCYRKLKAFYPEAIDEVKGFSDGHGEPDETVAAFLLSHVIAETAPRSTIFAYRNMRDTIFGRNHDTVYSLRKAAESALVCPAGGYAFVGQSDRFIGKADGINEKGLAAGFSYVNGPGSCPGVNLYFIVRYILEKCATVDEAIRIFDRVNPSHSGNILLADRSGYMAVVETTPEKCSIRLPEEDERFIVCTNRFRLPGMMPLMGDGRQSDDELYMAVASLLGAIPGLDVDGARKILSDRESGVYLDLRKERYGTLWSVIIGLTTLDAYRADGLPCKAAYKKDTRLSSLVRKHKSGSR